MAKSRSSVLSRQFPAYMTKGRPNLSNDPEWVTHLNTESTEDPLWSVRRLLEFFFLIHVH